MTAPLVPQRCPVCDTNKPMLVVLQEDGCGESGDLTMVELSCGHITYAPTAWLNQMEQLRRGRWQSTS